MSAKGRLIKQHSGGYNSLCVPRNGIMSAAAAALTKLTSGEHPV
jgi:hypothetical protein